MKNVQKLLKKTFFIFWATFRQHLLTNPIEMTSENDTIFEKLDFWVKCKRLCGRFKYSYNIILNLPEDV